MCIQSTAVCSAATENTQCYKCKSVLSGLFFQQSCFLAAIKPATEDEKGCTSGFQKPSWSWSAVTAASSNSPWVMQKLGVKPLKNKNPIPFIIWVTKDPTEALSFVYSASSRLHRVCVVVFACFYCAGVIPNRIHIFRLSKLTLHNSMSIKQVRLRFIFQISSAL